MKQRLFRVMDYYQTLMNYKNYLHMLKDIRQQAQTMINNESDLEEIINSNITAKYDKLYSDTFINSGDFLTFVYNDLKHK